MAKAKYDYVMDYIPDKQVYKAVQFASKLIRENMSANNAIRRASKYYDVDMSEVAHYVGQKGGRRRNEKR